MDHERRSLLILGAMLAGAAAAGEAGACSLTGRRKARTFRRDACEKQIRDLVEMLNRAPTMSADAVEAWYDEHRFGIDGDLTEEVEGDGSDLAFLRGFRLSSGRLDSRPIRLAELDLVRQRGNRAAFGFTLIRYSYHPADPEGCNGLFTHDEYLGEERAGYIAAFADNRMESLRAFPEWFAGRG